MAVHPLVLDRFGELPPPGSCFADKDRRLWLDALRANLEFVYGRVEDAAQPPVCRRS